VSGAVSTVGALLGDRRWVLVWTDLAAALRMRGSLRQALRRPQTAVARQFHTARP